MLKIILTCPKIIDNIPNIKGAYAMKNIQQKSTDAHTSSDKLPLYDNRGKILLENIEKLRNISKEQGKLANLDYTIRSKIRYHEFGGIPRKTLIQLQELIIEQLQLSPEDLQRLNKESIASQEALYGEEDRDIYLPIEFLLQLRLARTYINAHHVLLRENFINNWISDLKGNLQNNPNHTLLNELINALQSDLKNNLKDAYHCTSLSLDHGNSCWRLADAKGKKLGKKLDQYQKQLFVWSYYDQGLKTRSGPSGFNFEERRVSEDFYLGDYPSIHMIAPHDGPGFLNYREPQYAVTNELDHNKITAYAFTDEFMVPYWRMLELYFKKNKDENKEARPINVYLSNRMNTFNLYKFATSNSHIDFKLDKLYLYADHWQCFSDATISMLCTFDKVRQNNKHPSFLFANPSNNNLHLERNSQSVYQNANLKTNTAGNINTTDLEKHFNRTLAIDKHAFINNDDNGIEHPNLLILKLNGVRYNFNTKEYNLLQVACFIKVNVLEQEKNYTLANIMMNAQIGSKLLSYLPGFGNLHRHTRDSLKNFAWVADMVNESYPDWSTTVKEYCKIKEQQVNYIEEQYVNYVTKRIGMILNKNSDLTQDNSQENAQQHNALKHEEEKLEQQPKPSRMSRVAKRSIDNLDTQPVKKPKIMHAYSAHYELTTEKFRDNLKRARSKKRGKHTLKS